MKTVGILIGVIFIIGGVFWWSTRDNTSLPTDEPVVVEPQQMDGDMVSVHTGESRLEWTGRKILIPGYVDVGTVDILGGTLIVRDGKVVGGTIVFDMETIAVNSTSNVRSGGEKLAEHLKSDDFFSVDTYPESQFVITNVEAQSELSAENATHMVTGNLTIKDVTADLSFPARIIIDEDGRIIVTARFDIDRTRWNIRYGSGSFFQNLGDNVIDDMITFDVRVVTQ